MSRNTHKTKENISLNSDMISKKVSLVFKKMDFIKEKKDGKVKLIEKLNSSNDDLAIKLKILTSADNCLKEMEHTEKILTLTKEMDNLDDQIKTEKAYIKDLEKQILQTERNKLKFSNTNEAYKTSLHHDGENKHIRKRKEVLKEKLHAASCHLGIETANNSQMKEKIKSLISERKNFNDEYNNLLDKLVSGKKVMENLSTSFKNASLLRDNITSKIEKIHSQENKHLKLHTEEAQTLAMRRDCESTWQTFYLTKTKQRIVKTVQKKSPSIHENLFDKVKAYNSTIQSIINQYEQIKSKKPIENSDIVFMFQKENSEIWSLFSYATLQNHEMEVLKERIISQEKEFNEAYLKEEEMKLTHEQLKKDLEDFKQHLEESRLHFIEEKNSSVRILNKLYEGIHRLVELTKADISDLLFLLGENDKVTEFNYNFFLQAVETRLVLLLQELDLPQIPLMSQSLVKEQRNKTIESQAKSFSRSLQSSLDHRVTITILCRQCYPFDEKVKKSLCNVDPKKEEKPDKLFTM